MSIEDLQSDLAANLEEVKGLSALSTVGDVTNHLKNTLWPFLENVVREQGEMDAALRDMYEQSEDVLQYETGKQIAAVVGGAMTLIGALEAKMIAATPPGTAPDPQLASAIKEWRARAAEVGELLEDITLPEDFADGEDEGDEDGEDEGEGEDDEDDGKEVARG